MGIEKKEHGFDSITGMRGIACLFIMCFHYFCLYIDDPGLGTRALPLYPYSEFFFIYSKNAVELFFMLSGFLTAYHYRTKIASMKPFEYMKKHYGKLIIPSVIVTFWALANAFLTLKYVPGSEEFVSQVTPLRVVLSALMVNTGWVTSYNQTQLPINSTMWFVNVLLLCYIIYYVICKLAKKNALYMILCGLMVILGWICLDHSPKLPFLWALDGRGYATFFLGALLCEFQTGAGEKARKGVSLAWGIAISVFFIARHIIGFGNIFGDIGSSSYVRYFEFIAAPGLILAVLNIEPLKKILEWKPFIWLGALSAPLYYLHNNLMEDYRILNCLAGNAADFSAWYVFLAVLLSVIPFAMLWQFAGDKYSGKALLQGGKDGKDCSKRDGDEG